MNNDPVYQRLREIGWRQRLTKAEQAEQAELQAWLAAHPEAAAEIEAETALNRALASLPDAPMPSNFTARILQAVEQAERPRARRRDWAWVLRVLMPRAAVAAVVLSAGGLVYQNHRAEQRVSIGNSIETVLGVTTLPSPEILADFDVIQKLDSSSTADQELIALLQ